MTGLEYESNRNIELESYRYRAILGLGKDKAKIGVYTNSSAYNSYLLNELGDLNTPADLDHPRYAVVLVERDELNIEYDPSKRVLAFEGNADVVLPNLVYVAYAYSEAPRQEEKRFTLHAAAVADSEGAILILGEKGSGKTSLALSLCLKQGYRVIGNDILVAGALPDGRVGVYGGDGTFKLRKISMHNFPELDSVVQFNNARNLFETKAHLDPNLVGIHVETQPLPIKKALYVFLSATDDVHLHVDQIPENHLRLRLNENTSRYIRGLATPILNKEGQLVCNVPSFDCAKFSRERLAILEQLIASLDIQTVSSGNLEELTNFVAQT